MSIPDLSQRNYWSSRARLDDLSQRINTCLRGLPEFQELSYFGSTAEGRSDGYSDLDITVTTDDLSAARLRLLKELEATSPIESCWLISMRPGESNLTIIFAEEGYYHRLDLGLIESGTINPPPEQTTLLMGDPSHIMPRGSKAYMPPYGSVGHFLLGQFIGGVRYCKARKRGQALSCYRFVSAAADWCLRTLYVYLTGSKLSGQAKLSTEEYLTLDHIDTNGRGYGILATLDYSTPKKMDLSICRVLQQMYCFCKMIAAVQNEDLADDVFQRMLTFICDELSVVSDSLQ